ncbi:MAG TPA: hypothetical protein VN641_05985, partial [Urbifossiella sp.]|nr:hypothetical protein [Urbifossiella sp.]
MKKIYFAAAAAACAAAAGGVYAWPSAPMLSASTPAEKETRVWVLPSIVTPPNESPVTAVSVKVPKDPPPPLPLPIVPIVRPIPKAPKDPPLPLKLPLAIVQPIQNVVKEPQPMPLAPPTRLVPPAPATVGSVVLLKDGKMVEGAASHSGTRVIVQRGTSHREFDKSEVQFIGKSKDECYRFKLGQVKADDAPGRYKLARWCMYSGMREQALTEAKAVVKLQANYTPAIELARTMEESLRLFNDDGTPKIDVSPKPTATLLPQAIEPEPDIPAEAIKAFTAHVQPVLVNLCADCHGKPSYAGAFKMACGGPVNDPALTRFNLKAAVGQVKKSDPAASPLLMKALAAHGGMKQAALANGAAP